MFLKYSTIFLCTLSQIVESLPIFTSGIDCLSKGAFTPDTNDANKSRYLREVGRLNIFSLLAPFAREIRAIRALNSLHNRREFASWEGLLPGLVAKCIPVFEKYEDVYTARVPTYNHNYFVLHCCL